MDAATLLRWMTYEPRAETQKIATSLKLLCRLCFDGTVFYVLAPQYRPPAITRLSQKDEPSMNSGWKEASGRCAAVVVAA